MPEAKGRILAGKYRLVRRLGQGGMGAVWLARHTELDTSFAVKLMNGTEASAVGRARFKREAKAAAQLDCPNVVRTFDYGVDRGEPYIVMELLRGEDLHSRLRRGALSLGETATVVEQLASALSAAHTLGLVHRDIKPRNVFLLTNSSGGLQVKLLDFGIAKDLHGELVGDDTASGVVLGSPHYMSPEQARGNKVDGRSDLWSLAVVAFEMLTTHRAFDGSVLGDIIAKICSEPPPLLSELAPELPAALDGWFAQALDRDPAARFQTPEQLHAALAAIAIHAPEARCSLEPLCVGEQERRDRADSDNKKNLGDDTTVAGDALLLAAAADSSATPSSEDFGRSASTLNVSSQLPPTSLSPRRMTKLASAAATMVALVVGGWVIAQPAAVELAAGVTEVATAAIDTSADLTATHTTPTSESMAANSVQPAAPSPSPPPQPTQTANASRGPAPRPRVTPVLPSPRPAPAAVAPAAPAPPPAPAATHASSAGNGGNPDAVFGVPLPEGGS